MKRMLIAALVLLAGSYAAFGQEESFRKTFSLELGVGPGPLHMMYPGVSPSDDIEAAWADQGRRADKSTGYYPAVTLSGAIRTWDRWETVVTAGLSWYRSRLIQYESFGIDPQGKPRYDLKKATPVGGWTDSSPIASLTVQERVFWNPRWKAQMYSAFGLGLTTSSSLVPIPSLMPVCIRLGGRHLYGYAEAGFTPFASCLHGGLGWKF
ncbi:MAG: hypothetical protein IKP01_06425 [Bacteroidales bacterium]|nr:hypothetical protein [Bacteroidales bacterium]MBR3097733.1 hypothetical protein [Bacteroidales bacterium]MBR4687939.1 hypothetical protein [Bacteroidales bacterium]